VTVVPTRLGALGAVETGVVRGFDRLHATADELDDLAVRCGAPVTARPSWVFATLAHEPEHQPWGVLVRDRDGALVGSALLVDVPARGRDLVRLAGSGSGYRGALVADGPRAADRLGRELAAALSGRDRPWRIALGPLDVGSAGAGALVAALPGAAYASVDSIPVVRRDGTSDVDAYLSSTVRRTLRKARNRLGRDGRALTVRFSRDRNRIVRLLPTLEECHRDRDHDRGRDSDLDDTVGRLLWNARLRALAMSGALELATARVDGQLAAYVLGIPDGEVYRVLEGHLVTEWSRYAPGRVLEAAVLSRVLDDERFDSLDWMTSVASDTLLASNAADPMVVVRAG
jgi:hypothetical protein